MSFPWFTAERHCVRSVNVSVFKVCALWETAAVVMRTSFGMKHLMKNKNAFLF